MTAHYMWRRFFNTHENCPDDAKAPEYECTGILLRATSPSKEPQGGWIPKPKSYPGVGVSGGGVSFSYIRADSKFGRLAFSYTNGFTVYPSRGKYADPKPNATKLDVLCAFPLDAATDDRSNAGCGPRGAQGALCAGASATEDGWMKIYDEYKDTPNAGFAYRLQCGFDMRHAARHPADFTTYLKIRDRLRRHHPSTFSEVDELRIATWAPTMAVAASKEASLSFPIESFFLHQRRGQ